MMDPRPLILGPYTLLLCPNGLTFARKVLKNDCRAPGSDAIWNHRSIESLVITAGSWTSILAKRAVPEGLGRVSSSPRTGRVATFNIVAASLPKPALSTNASLSTAAGCTRVSRVG